jgi:hypothetical protein
VNDLVNDPVNDRASEPFLRVVRGAATDEELAALVAVLLARPAPPGAGRAGPASTWSDRSATLRGRVPWSPGPDAWRAARLRG